MSATAPSRFRCSGSARGPGRSTRSQFSSHTGYRLARLASFDARRRRIVRRHRRSRRAGAAAMRCCPAISARRSRRRDARRRRRRQAPPTRRRLLLRPGDRRRRHRRLCRAGVAEFFASAPCRRRPSRRPTRSSCRSSPTCARRRPRRRAARDRRLAGDRTARRAGDVADAKRCARRRARHDRRRGRRGVAPAHAAPADRRQRRRRPDRGAVLLHWLRGRPTADALAAAASSVYGVVAATVAAGARELRLVEAQDELVRPTRRFRPEAIYGRELRRTARRSATRGSRLDRRQRASARSSAMRPSSFSRSTCA